MSLTRALVIAFAGTVALVGVGLVRAGRTERKQKARDRIREKATGVSSLETVGLGLLLIGLVGVLVDLAG